MEARLFEFQSYKKYLLDLVGPRTSRSGLKGKMAAAIACQATYISQVLYGKAQLSLEQAELLSAYLSHSQKERHYFLLLVQKDRAGTKALSEYFQEQLDRMQSERLDLTKRLNLKNSLGPDAQSMFYSSWHYLAVQIALTIPELRSVEALAKYLGIPKRRITKVLDFLIGADLVSKEGGHFIPGTNVIRLGRDSPNIVKHHVNCRNLAIERLDFEELQDLHYSGLFSLSHADIIKLKSKIMDFIQESVSFVRESKEEDLYCLNIDFFTVARR